MANTDQYLRHHLHGLHLILAAVADVSTYECRLYELEHRTGRRDCGDQRGMVVHSRQEKLRWSRCWKDVGEPSRLAMLRKGTSLEFYLDAMGRQITHKFFDL